MSKISRRRFLHNTALLGATLPFGYTTRKASAQTTPTLDLYIAIWPNLTNTKLSWKTLNPQDLANEFSHMLWNYFRSHRYQNEEEALVPFKKTSVIGHASLFAELRNGDATSHIVFSNTGGNPGFYGNPNILISSLSPLPSHKFPEKYRNFDRLIGPGFFACFFVDELLAGHVSDGKWESPNEYSRRISRNNNFKVEKHQYTGNRADDIWNLLKIVEEAMDKAKKERHIGTPIYFGLNTTAVRDVNNFDQKLPLHLYNIGGTMHPIPGGCANAVASILVAIGLGNKIPDSARFSLNKGRGIDLKRFKEISIPIVTRDQEYENKEPTDQKLKTALSSVPTEWGNGGEQIEFVDPNYWHPTLNDNKMLKEQFKTKVQLASKV